MTGGDIGVELARLRAIEAESMALAAELERSHRETELWYETSKAFLRTVVRLTGVNYAEELLDEAVNALGRNFAFDPADEAARVLIDRYRERVARLEHEAAVEFATVIGGKIRSDISTPRRYPLGFEPVAVEPEKI